MWSLRCASTTSGSDFRLKLLSICNCGSRFVRSPSRLERRHRRPSRSLPHFWVRSWPLAALWGPGLSRLGHSVFSLSTLSRGSLRWFLRRPLGLTFPDSPRWRIFPSRGTERPYALNSLKLDRRPTGGSGPPFCRSPPALARFRWPGCSSRGRSGLAWGPLARYFPLSDRRAGPPFPLLRPVLGCFSDSAFNGFVSLCGGTLSTRSAGGGCTFAFQQGAVESDLALHGDWRSSAVRAYYPADGARLRVASLLSGNPPPFAP